MLLSLVIQSRKWRHQEPSAPEFVAWRVILSGIVALGVECFVVVVDVELTCTSTSDATRSRVFST